MRLAVAVALTSAPAATGGAAHDSDTPFTIAAKDFQASQFPFNTSFFGTTPYPDKSGLDCGEDANTGERCFFRSDDPWLKATLPVWRPAAGAATTLPWTDGFSAPRLLGGIANHDPETNTYTPNLDFEIVTRGSNGELVYNWTRIDVTIDGWLHDAKTTRFLLVLDNVPIARLLRRGRSQQRRAKQQEAIIQRLEALMAAALKDAKRVKTVEPLLEAAKQEAEELTVKLEEQAAEYKQFENEAREREEKMAAQIKELREEQVVKLS